MHEDQMRHNMRSDAADEASIETTADDVDPTALVGMKVNMPAASFFGDDAMPSNCESHGVGLFQRYIPWRKKRPPCYEMLVTHPQWPPNEIGLPTLFECRADGIHAQLSDDGLLIPDRTDPGSHADGPVEGGSRKGKRQGQGGRGEGGNRTSGRVV
jgi:hypothetical protein